jgi:CHAT domain-containing protein/outer membrane protein assembly factor BamD (BamD/ComL family)
MVDPHTKGCPEPEVLAAYVDRGLSLSERARVDAHLASCRTCLALVAGVARTVEELSASQPGVAVTVGTTPRVAWRAWAGGLAAAAAVIAVVITPALVQPWLDRESGLVSLVDSVGEHRSVLGRLTGGFPHAPLGELSAGGQDSRAAGTDRVQLTSGRIHESFGDRTTPSQLHALGVAYLLDRRLDDAVQALVSASREQPANAQYLSDVAAVQLERARVGLRPDDLPRALAAADRARRLDPSLPEAWFNRALAASALSLTAEARASWTEYLRRDSTSRWAAEARTRLEELSKPTPATAWTSIEGRLQQSFDAATADEAVRTQVTASRNFLENTLVVAWADAVLRGESGEQEFERVRVMAAAIARSSGDALYTDAAAAIDRSSGNARTALARNHKAYSEGAAALADDRFAAAADILRTARLEFTKSGSPFAYRAALDLGAAAYFTGRVDEASAMLEAAGKASRTAGYSNIAARVSWQQGLAAMGRGELADAQTKFEDTLAGFERMNDAEQVANAHNLLASLYFYLGDSSNEWRHRSEALQGLSVSSNPRFKYGLLLTAAASARATTPEAALPMLDAALTFARASGRTAAVTETLTNMSATKLALGSVDDAKDDIVASRHELAQISDVQFQRRMEVAILSIESDLLRSTNPRAAAEAATRAIDIVRQRGDRLRLAQLNLRLAKAAIASGRLAEAEAALTSGIGEFDVERGSLVSDDRISTLDESWQLFDTAVHLAIRRGDYARAFEMAERARLRTAAESQRLIAGRTLEQVESALAPGEAVLALNQFDDELSVWLIKREGTTVVTRPLSRLHADLLVSRQREEIRREASESAAGSTLYDEIVRPMADALNGVARIKVVADGPSQNAAFAALRNRSTGRYLVEDFALTQALSVNAAVTGRAVESTARTTPLVIGGPEAAGNASEVASVYPNATLLSGPYATSQQLLEQAMNRPIVHISARTADNSAYPLLSRVVLADSNGQQHSGALFGRDIAARQMNNTGLVVIDQIESSGSPRYESTLGLARAFLAAGVPEVLRTLPGTDETAIRQLMVEFHRLVASGQTAGQALSTLQRNAIRSNGRRLGAWSALVLHGSDR